MTDRAIDRTAPTERVALDGGSWVDVTRGLVIDPDEVLADTIAGARWQHTDVWRFDRYVEERRLGAWMSPENLPSAFRQTGLALDARYGVHFEGVSVVYYRDGADHQGLHTDRDMRWLDDTLVGILVLGARRPFVLRPRLAWEGGTVTRDGPRAGEGPNDVVLTPGRGDLVVLGGRCQADWLHGVPAAPGLTDPRLSVIWRWSARRGRPDTGPRYRDGRHFSDSPRRPGSRSRPV